MKLPPDKITGPQSNPVRTPEKRTLGRFLFQAISLAVIMIVSLGGYLTVLSLRGPAAQVETYLPLDGIVPFHHAWVWVYLLPYLIGPVVIGLLSWNTFTWYVSRGLVIVGLTLLIFIVFPTRTKEREPRELGNGFTAWMYQQMVAIDEPPANAAPSLHVSLTCLLALALLRDFPRLWHVTLVGVALVWLSTLATRQHHFLDVVTGVLMACLVVLGMARGSRRASSPAK